MDYKNILKLISDNLYCGIFIVDKHGNVLFYNKSLNDLAGLKGESAIGKHLLEIFPRLTNETSTIIKTLNTGQGIKEHVQNYYNYQNKLVTILSTTVPLYENNELVGAIEIFSDVEKYNHLENSKKNKSVIGHAIYTLSDIIGHSKEKQELKNKIIKTANSCSPVLVYGETGTGKELVVQCLHNEGSRKNKPFIAQNCAAIPATLFESILFGTKLGSFTGAKNSKGLIEAADGGTLFLDEINSMDLSLQAKLLRFLQEKTIRRLGDNQTQMVDVRIIAALNENPYEAIAAGRLRNDLFYRLNAINFYLSPLRESKSDINDLSNYYLDYFNKQINKNVQGFSNEVMFFFNSYSWPGNVRELRHIIEHAINITEKSIITFRDLPDYINTKTHKDNSIQVDNLDVKYPNFSFDGSLSEQLEQYERKIIIDALHSYNCNITRTAKKLGIPRQTLYYKMDKLNIKLDKNAE